MVGTVLQHIVALVRTRWLALAPVAIAVGFLDALVGVLLSVIVTTVPATPDPQSVDGGVVLGLFLATTLSFVVSLVVNAIMFNMVASLDTTGHADVNDALGVTVRRLGSLVGLVLLTALAVFFGFILLVIPGIFVAVSLVPAMAVLFLEGRGAVESFTRSFALVSGHWWQVFWLLTIVALFGFALGFVTRAPGIAGFLLSVLTSAILAVVQPALVYFIYRELRAAKGGPHPSTATS